MVSLVTIDSLVRMVKCLHACSLLPLTTHPQLWTKLLTFKLSIIVGVWSMAAKSMHASTVHQVVALALDAAYIYTV